VPGTARQLTLFDKDKSFGQPSNWSGSPWNWWPRSDALSDLLQVEPAEKPRTRRRLCLKPVRPRSTSILVSDWTSELHSPLRHRAL